MAISREEAKRILTSDHKCLYNQYNCAGISCLKCEYANDEDESEKALNQAISDMEKLQKIEDIISKQDELYGTPYKDIIVSGYSDLFEMIEQILKEVE